MNAATIAEIRELLEKGNKAQIAYKAIHERFENVENTAVYGDNMNQWIPDHEYVHQLLMRAISPYVSPAAKILDLGAGTGRVSKLILETFEACCVTLLDYSANMLGEAPQKLGRFANRYDIVQGDFFEAGVTFPPATFDCVVSVFAVCHGRDEQVYEALYQKIYDWLKPAGCFICFDHVRSATPELALLGFQDWADFIALNFTEEIMRDIIISTIKEDSPLPLQRHLDLLKQAGFEAADILWKRYVFALYCGLKTGGK